MTHEQPPGARDKLTAYLEQIVAVHERGDYLLLSQEEKAALARAVIRYRKELAFSIDYRTFEEIDADLAKALGVEK